MSISNTLATASGDDEEPWHSRKKWADGFKPQLEKIAQEAFGKMITLLDAPLEEDLTGACDYHVYVPSSGRMGCRVRSQKGYWDWTIRHETRWGSTTESEKLRYTDLRWYLVAWVEKDQVVAWVLIDLNVVRRKGLIEEAIANRQIKRQADGSFLWVPVVDLLGHQACKFWRLPPWIAEEVIGF